MSAGSKNNGTGAAEPVEPTTTNPKAAPATDLNQAAAGPDSPSGLTKTQGNDKPSSPGLIQQMLASSWLVVVGAIVVALVVGAILIAAADQAVQEAAGYFFARPGDLFTAAWSVVSDSYAALFRGAVINYQADSWDAMIRPLTITLQESAPLILAGLGLAVGFRAGLFNIGAKGQILLGATLCAIISFKLGLPPVIHPLACLIGAIAGGAAWGFIPGILKAKTGANEVIVTIMLNAIAGFLVLHLLTLKPMQRPGSNNPQAPLANDSALFGRLFGDRFPTDFGFVLALLAVLFTWWLLERSTLGFRLKAVGANPAAARSAGMNVNTTFIWVMVISGGLAGAAASTKLLAASGAMSLSANVAATYGFDAITVALLGRSKPLGTALAGLLFGAFRAGGSVMYATTATPIDIVLVVESIIVLMIAAPPLVRAIFRLPDAERAARREAKQAARQAASQADPAAQTQEVAQ
ncbi:MAG: ABC transporter permease [Micrococcales bacterium]|nr:ABC transporter permease [Micrococcales bacterium]